VGQYAVEARQRRRVDGGVRASESERVRSRKRGLALVVLAVGGKKKFEREREGRRCACGDRHYFMEFWLGLSTNLVRCSEDDGRRKEKRGAYDRRVGGERGSERENIKTGDDGVLCRDWRIEITTH
jgi:hypothetical protein